MAGRKRRTRRGSIQHSEDDRNMQESVDIGEQSGANAPSELPANGTQRKSKRQKTAPPEAAIEKRVESAGSDAETQDVDPTTQLDVPHPRSHTYGTRAKNQYRRPGQDVGLNWEEKRKEKDAADAARAQKRIQEDLKKAKAQAKAQHEHDGIQRIAALELSREQEDNEETEYMGRTGTARGYRSASSKARMGQDSSHSDRGCRDRVVSDSEYQDDDAYSLTTDQESAREDKGAENEELEEDEALEETVRVEKPAPKKRKTAAERKREKQKQVRGRIAEARESLPKKHGRNAGYSQASDVPHLSDDGGGEDNDARGRGDSEEEVERRDQNSQRKQGGRDKAPRSAFVSRTGTILRSGQNQDGSEDSDDTPLVLSVRKSAKKGGQSGAALVPRAEDDVPHPDEQPPKKTRPNGKRSNAASTPASRRQVEEGEENEEDASDDAFRPAYRAALLQKTSHPRSSGDSTPNHAARAPRTPTRAEPPPSVQLRFRLPGDSPPPVATPTVHRGRSPSQDDRSRGLNDDDVTLGRDTVLDRPRGRQQSTLQVVYAEPEPPQKPKAKRTSQADMDPEESLSMKSLPSWIKTEFSSMIVPTILEHFGGQEDPWMLDSDKPTKAKPVRASSSTGQSEEQIGIVHLIQQLIDRLFPHKQYELLSNDVIVRVARQRVLNWRRAFLDRAIKAAALAYAEFKKKHPEASKRDVADWADSAMNVNTGLGLWEAPPTDKNPKPHGGLRSPYLLRTFSPHFNSIHGSILADKPPPVGALALSLAALDIAFDCYTSGSLKPPESHFDLASAGVATKDWYKLAVIPNLTPRERWDTVMDVAKQSAPRGSSSAKSRGPARRRRSGVMPGSSPMRS